MKICKKCESDDFEHVYASVWRCKTCGKLDGKLSDLKELGQQVPPKIKRQKKKFTDYSSIILKCKKCKIEIISLTYPLESEFKKMQGAWKRHQCLNIEDNQYL